MSQKLKSSPLNANTKNFNSKNAITSEKKPSYETMLLSDKLNPMH